MTSSDLLFLAVAGIGGFVLAYSDIDTKLRDVEWSSGRIGAKAWKRFSEDDWRLMRKMVALCLVDNAAKWLKRWSGAIFAIGWISFAIGLFVAIGGTRWSEDVAGWIAKSLFTAPSVLGIVVRGRIWLLVRRLATI